MRSMTLDSRLAKRVAAGLLGFVAALAPLTAHPGVQAEVDAQTVDEMETVQLRLRADGVGNQVDTQLDLSELEKDFEVLGTNSSSQFQILNGQTSSWIEYRISLRPKRTGTLTIPPISVLGERSQPLQIAVRPLSPEVRQAIDRLVFFEVDVEPNPVYVQAQALLTRRLYYSSGVQIYSDLPGAPDLPNAVVLPLGDTRSTTEVRPQGRYGVLVQTYAIFPEHSGALTIPEISVASSVRLQSGDRTRRSGIRVRSPELRLEVLPVPSAYPADQTWLPAKQVSISDAWEPGSLAFEAGKPVRRTLSVRVTGNTGSAIPPLDPHLPGRVFKEYPEPVAISEETAAMDLVGTREQPYSIVPVAPGALQLPEIQLTWWDTVNDRVRVATVAAQRTQVAGDARNRPAPSANNQAPTGALPEVGNRPPDDAAATPINDPEYANNKPAPEPGAVPAKASLPRAGAYPTAYPTWLVALTLFAFCGWGATGLMMRRNRKRPTKRRPDSQSDKSWRILANACRQGNVRAIRDAWIRHLGAHWNRAPDQTVEQLRQHPEGRRLLDALNRSLYSPDSSTAPSGADILAVTRSLQKPVKPQTEQSLPELHKY